MKIAILTKYYKNYNYGGVLQGYALKKVLEEMGYTADIISYDVSKNQNPVYKSVIQQSKQYGLNSAINKVLEKLIGKFKFLIKDLINERKALFDEFMKSDNEEYDDTNLSQLNEKYDAFISGSDQVWNPNAVRMLFLQGFVNEKKKKISYAASIGRDKLDKDEAEILAPYLKRFDKLSVREKTAKKILNEYIDKEIEVVLDPTMLVEKNQWENIASEPIHDKPYVLFYFFSDSLEIRKKAIEFCKKRDIDLLMIPYANQKFNTTDSRGPGVRLNNVGPKEFISAIKNAEYIFTDSFHGVAFSIITERNFFVFERNKKEHVSMNSRIYDLLDTFNLKNRLINSEEFDKVENLDKINYKEVNNLKHELKEKSIKYLRESLD